MEITGQGLPAFDEWSNQFVPPLDAHTYLKYHSTVTATALFTDVMFPELILIRGCVLRREAYSPENFESWWSSVEGNTVAIEGVLNHLHLWDIFHPEGEAEERALERLAERMAQTWRLAAEEQFPDRVFTIEAAEDYGPTVFMTSEPRA